MVRGRRGVPRRMMIVRGLRPPPRQTVELAVVGRGLCTNHFTFRWAAAATPSPDYRIIRLFRHDADTCPSVHPGVSGFFAPSQPERADFRG